MSLRRHSFFIYGQLIREDNAALDKSYVYEYNGIGNLNCVKRYSYTTGELSGTPGTTSFSYTNDKLTSFGSKAITYNTSGGVSSYDGWDYSWNNGKLSELRKELSNGSRIISLPSSKTYSFRYNALSQRVGVSYNYIISPSDFAPVTDNEIISFNKEYGYDNAGRLIFETNEKTLLSGTTASTKIVFLYDEGFMVGFEYITSAGANIYYYLRNLQGDVIGIYDSYGNKVVDYTYDAWGNCTIKSTTTNYTVAHANPIRYRGYYYDEDTGLYYLNARYYNPEWRRFISPDDTAYLDPETPNGLNLYCYCNNDPVNYADPSGHWVETVFDVASLIYDIYCLNTNDGHKDWKNWVALGFDVACLVLPFVSGGSTLYRVANGVNNIDNVHDAIKSLEIAGDMSDIALVGRNADRVKGVGRLGYTYYEGLQCYNQLASKGWYGKVAAEIAGKTQNAYWLTKQLLQGRTIVDIGMEANMAMSSSYFMERTILSLYKARKYIRWGIRIGLEF